MPFSNLDLVKPFDPISSSSPPLSHKSPFKTRKKYYTQTTTTSSTASKGSISLKMAALSMPYWSIKPRTSDPVCKSHLFITKRSLSRIVGSTSTAAIKSWPSTVKKNVDVWYHDGYGAFKVRDEGLEEEIRGIIGRLEDAVERIRDLEVQKFMGRVRGTEFVKDGAVLAEMMSREIVSKFLEKPIMYLRSCDGNKEEKIKDINVLVGILEESYHEHISCSCIHKNP